MARGNFQKLNLKKEEAGALVLAPASDFRSQQKRHKPHCETSSMTTTNMHEAASAYKWRDDMASHGTFIPPEADAIQPASDCLWDRFDISPEARDIGDYLSALASRMSGEAIERLDTIAIDMVFSTDRVLDAMDELQAAGVIEFWCLHNRSGNDILHCAFSVDSDLYYGDDTTKPADCRDEENALNEYLGAEYDYEADEIVPPKGAPPPAADYDADADVVPFNDPNPKRHRIFLKTSYRCFYCITAWAEHVDHMHPRVRGGGNEDSNLIGACQPCNLRKKDRTVEEFRAYLAHRNRLPDISHVRFWGEAVN